MKKKLPGRGLLSPFTKKILLVMRLTLFFVVMSFFSAYSISYAQKTKLNIKVHNTQVKEVLNKIEKQSEFFFMYDNKQVDVERKVNLEVNSENIDQVLKKLFEGVDINFKVINRQILLFPSSLTNDFALPNKKITGTVTDEASGLTLPGVSILLQGTTKGAKTGNDGKYSIEVPDGNSILIFSFIGYETQKISTLGKSVIDVKLKTDVKTLNEIVVVGYGTQKKGNLTGSVSNLKGGELAQNASASVSNSLAGHTPGLIINNRSGEPGNDGATMLIRGFNSFGGGTSPLIVVDGIPDRDLNRLNPEDIESVTVLKDASAAIYGVRSANGVILITTKRGKSGKPSIHYDGSLSIQQLTRMDQRVNAWKYMTYYNELNLNQGNSAPYLQSDIDKYKAGNDPNYTSTNWIDAVFRKNAPQSNHSISVNGGNDQVKYYFSGQYLKQESNLRNSDEAFKEFNIRSNIDATITKNLKVNLDIAARKEDRTGPVISIASILHETVSMYPFLPVYWSNGLPDACISNGRNPVIMTSSMPGYNNVTNLIVNPKLGFDLQMPFITKGLSMNGYAAFDFNNRSAKTFQQPWDAYTYDKNTKTYNNQRASTSILSLAQDEQLTNENTYFMKVAYDRQFGEHAINAFVGFEETATTWKDTYAYRRDLLSNQLDQLFTGSAVNQNATGSASQDGRESYLGRLAYSYSNKYLADVTFRYNGSFNFPSDKRWGLFPAVSLGWRISEEKFFKDNIKVINQLKLRASWGLMGSDAVAQYLYVTRYQLSTTPEYYTYFGDNYTEAKNLYLSATPNPDITWEKQDTRNIGFDATLFSNKLNISFDAFRFLRKDILAQRNASVPLYTGLSLPAENIGKSLNRGVDFSIDYTEKKTVVKYHIGGNFTFAKSKIIFRDESPNIPAWQKSTGYAIDSWLVYQTKGIYHTQSEVDNSPHLAGAKPGDLWIKDVSGDGNITSDDMVRIAESATPKIMYGILMGAEYKGIALDMVWSGQGMAKQMVLPQMQGSVVAPPTWLYDGRWTTDNPNAAYPRAFNSNDTRNSVYADFWLKDASFLRLKSLQLSYTLPSNMFAKYGIAGVKVYVGGTNLFSFDSMKKYNRDPENNNITGVNYPQSRIFRLGLNIDL
jgi:TonB-linked SusC/RagA family outer membrane protein